MDAPQSECDGNCRMLLPEATRAWREGVPTVIVMETGYDLTNTSTAFQQGTTSHLEQFADYPDLTDRSFKMGDMRYEVQATSCDCLSFAHAGVVI